jgi:hypothetical protein
MRFSILPTSADYRRPALAWTVLIAGPFVFLHASAQPLNAQSASVPNRPSELTFVAGLAERRQLDVTASPLVFGGSGFSGAARLVRPIGGAFDLTTDIGGALQRLGTGANPAQERVIDGNADVALERRVAGDERTPRGAIILGGDVGVAVTSNLHQYATAAAPSALFLMISAGVGPSATWRARIGPGRASFSLHAPVVGLVDHPYSEAKSGSTPVALRTTTLGSLRQLDGIAQFTPDYTRRAGITFDYRFALLRYDDVQPLRSATQAFSIGIATQFGAPAERR